jgi:pimeloyl-ACP methyl ester carboxylesterase
LGAFVALGRRTALSSVRLVEHCRVRNDAHSLDFDGHRLSYAANGHGPALVIVSQYWRAEHEVQVSLLSDHWQLFHITPVGYGRSERVPGYAGEALADQVLAVLDRHQVDRFAIWGYSASGAMAACVGRATARAAAIVCGGLSLFDPLTPGTLRQLDSRLRPDHPSRDLWSWVNSWDWTGEVSATSRPWLVYWGSDDRQTARKLRRAQAQLSLPNVEFVEFAGLDHAGCGGRQPLRELVVPTVDQWAVASRRSPLVRTLAEMQP